MFRFTIRDVLWLMGLSGALGALLAAWLIHRPSRLYPFGRFVELGDMAAILLAAIVAAVALLLRQRERVN